jgi:CMP/dCMP kinase
MPIVTISRMYGAGGSEIAARVAASLGWTLLDNAIVEAVALRLGTSAAEVQAREERVPGMAQRLADALAFGSPEILPLLADGGAMPPSEERVLEMTRRVMSEAVAHGPAVLVGRGAQCLLAEREDAMHVFCYAPESALAARISGRDNLSAEEALGRVREINQQRDRYVKRHWNREWRSMANYHLCINTNWLGIDRAAELVTTTARTLLAV